MSAWRTTINTEKYIGIIRLDSKSSTSIPESFLLLASLYLNVELLAFKFGQLLQNPAFNQNLQDYCVELMSPPFFLIMSLQGEPG